MRVHNCQLHKTIRFCVLDIGHSQNVSNTINILLLLLFISSQTFHQKSPEKKRRKKMRLLIKSDSHRDKWTITFSFFCLRMKPNTIFWICNTILSVEEDRIFYVFCLLLFSMVLMMIFGVLILYVFLVLVLLMRLLSVQLIHHCVFIIFRIYKYALCLLVYMFIKMAHLALQQMYTFKMVSVLLKNRFVNKFYHINNMNV